MRYFEYKQKELILSMDQAGVKVNSEGSILDQIYIVGMYVVRNSLPLNLLVCGLGPKRLHENMNF